MWRKRDDSVGVCVCLEGRDDDTAVTSRGGRGDWPRLSLRACSALRTMKCDLEHVSSSGSSDSQLSDSSDARQAAEAERSREVKIYIPYESAELCVTQVHTEHEEKHCAPTAVSFNDNIILQIYRSTNQ